MNKRTKALGIKDKITVISYKRKSYKKSRHKKAMDRKLKNWAK